MSNDPQTFNEAMEELHQAWFELCSNIQVAFLDWWQTFKIGLGFRAPLEEYRRSLRTLSLEELERAYSKKQNAFVLIVQEPQPAYESMLVTAGYETELRCEMT